MRIQKSLLILTAFLLLMLVAAALHTGKYFIFEKIKYFVTEKLEASTGLGIKIRNAEYVPLKGLCLTGITGYKNNLYEEKAFSISYVFIRFPLIKFLFRKTLSPTITIHALGIGSTAVNGAFGIEIKTDTGTIAAKNLLGMIKSLHFYDLSIKNPFLNITNLNGEVLVSVSSIKSSDIYFVLNGRRCKLNLEIVEPLNGPSANLSISSQGIKLVLHIKREREIYRITRFTGKFFNSNFDLVGEISRTDEIPADISVSLYGTADTDIQDIIRFAPVDIRESLERLKPTGIFTNSVYFKSKLRNVQNCELGIKSNAKSLRIGELELQDIRIDARLKNETLEMPLINVNLYGGTLISQAVFNLKDVYISYRASSKLHNLKISELLKNTPLKDRGIRGDASVELAIEGKVKDIDSVRGSGRILIKNANLGPMPLLTPLLGHIYGYFQRVFPELKKINISGGTADFYIRDRRLTTNNLLLTSDIVGISAKGYIDFDKNLNFEVENEVLQEASESTWQASLQSLIARFGKIISKAYLTGTLKNPKWKFEYFGGIQNIFKGKLKNILKGILE